jgi:hypothetical protein
MRKADVSPEKWEEYKAYMREWYRKQPDDKKAGIKKRCYAYANRHPEYRRDEQYRRLYGITLADYDRMRAEQDYCCRLCRKHETEVWARRPWGQPRRHNARLVVDHNHDTGQVRGLLCDQCNTILGMVGDDPVALARMADYLLGFKPLRLVS